MQVMKICRVGNSNVVSLLHGLERLGYTVGTTVLVNALPDGTVCIVPTDRVRACMEKPDQPSMVTRHDAPRSVADGATSQPEDSSSMVPK